MAIMLERQMFVSNVQLAVCCVKDRLINALHVKKIIFYLFKHKIVALLHSRGNAWQFALMVILRQFRIQPVKNVQLIVSLAQAIMIIVLNANQICT